MSDGNGNGNGHKTKVTAAMMAAPPEIDLDVTFLSGQGTFKAYFDDMDPATERQYRRICNKGARGARLRQSDLEEGMHYVFKLKFKETNIDLTEMLAQGEYKDERDYFLRDPVGKRYVTGMMGTYLDLTRVDATDTKD